MFKLSKVDRKSLRTVILRSLLFFAGLGFIYYIFFVFPYVRSMQTLGSVRVDTSSAYYHLLQNRTAYVELIKLDPISSDFDDDRSSLLGKLEPEGEKLDNIYQSNYTYNTFAANKNISVLVKDKFTPTLNDLSEESKAVLASQGGYLNSYKEFEPVLKNIYLYDFEDDIGYLEFPANKDLIVERSKNAENGVQKIRENLDAFGKNNPQTVELSSALVDLENEFRILNTLAQHDQADLYDTQKKVVESRFENTKTLAWSTQTGMFKSNEFVNLLTRQTNLILKYENLLSELSDNQKIVIEKIP